MLVLLYEDLVSDCPGSLKRICAFLGVDENHRFDAAERDNETVGIPRSRLLRRLLRSAGPVKSLIRRTVPRSIREKLFQRFSGLIWEPKPVLQPAVRAELVAGFKADILELQEITGRDLSAWLRC